MKQVIEDTLLCRKRNHFRQIFLYFDIAKGIHYSIFKIQLLCTKKLYGGKLLPSFFPYHQWKNIKLGNK